jgi:hypothetical protein
MQEVVELAPKLNDLLCVVRDVLGQFGEGVLLILDADVAPRHAAGRQQESVGKVLGAARRIFEFEHKRIDIAGGGRLDPPDREGAHAKPVAFSAAAVARAGGSPARMTRRLAPGDVGPAGGQDGASSAGAAGI